MERTLRISKSGTDNCVVSVSKGKKIEYKISTQSICSKMRARRNDDEENTTKLVLGMIIAEQVEKFVNPTFLRFVCL